MCVRISEKNPEKGSDNYPCLPLARYRKVEGKIIEKRLFPKTVGFKMFWTTKNLFLFSVLLLGLEGTGVFCEDVEASSSSSSPEVMVVVAASDDEDGGGEGEGGKVLEVLDLETG